MHQIKAEITRHSAPIRSPTQAALAVNLPVENIVKTVLLKGSNGEMVACVIPKSAKLNLSRVQALLGWNEQPKHLEYLEIKKITSFSPGGIPPLGFPETVTIIVDTEVLNKTVIAGPAGDEFHTLKLETENFKKIPNTVITDDIKLG